MEVVLAAEAKQRQQKSQRKRPTTEKLNYQPKAKWKKSQPEGQHQKTQGTEKKDAEKGKASLLYCLQTTS